METPITIAVLGSAFDPPHLGHMDVIHQALTQADMAVVVPSAVHPFGKQMAPFDDRVRMLVMIVNDVFGPQEQRILVSGIEDNLAESNGGKPVYTFHMLEALENQLRRQFGNFNLKFVVGPDNAKREVWQKFYRHEEIEQRWGLLVAQENLRIRSTTVRQVIQQIKCGQVAIKGLSRLVGDALAQYLCSAEGRAGLYSSSAQRSNL